MIRSWTKGGIAIAAIVALSACDDATGVEALDDELVLDMALLAADATLEDVALWGMSLSLGGPAGVSAHPGHPGGHDAYTSYTASRTVTFYDEAGGVMDAYDPLLTASVRIEHEMDGEASRSGWTAEIHRERDKTVSGLVGEETHRTWNGTGSEQISRSRHLDDGTERSYDSDASIEYEDVVVPIPGSDPRWPLSGTIRRTMTVERSGPDGDVTRTVEVVITFNGTSVVTALVNGEEIEIDLAARATDNPVRRPRG